MSVPDAYDRFAPRERGRFGDNELAADSPTRAARSNLVDLDLYLRNDNPAKKAIAVSADPAAPFARWIWLPRALIEYVAVGREGCLAIVRVTLPEYAAKQKGLI